MEGHKTCPKGEYYCYTDKKCKEIPGGYHVGRGGYLERDDNNDSEETNGSKNDSSNGSNGSNGNGMVKMEAVEMEVEENETLE